MLASRRAFLASAGAALGSTALAGCTGVGGLVGSGEDPVTVLAAGSLQHAFDTALRDAVDARITVEARGSATAARLVADGQRDPDVLALADVALFERLLDDAWHATFATNALCVATADTAGGRAVRNAGNARQDGTADGGDGDSDEAAHWFDRVVDGSAALGRTDPDLDPLGYRTLFMLDLAARRRDRPGLRDAVLSSEQVYPETALLSGFETGALDAAVVYESMAVERDYEFVDLAPEIDLSAPMHASAYAETSHELRDGVVVQGDVIEYGATLRSADDAAAERVFDAVVDGALVAQSGFGVPGEFPQYSENAPKAVVDG